MQRSTCCTRTAISPPTILCRYAISTALQLDMTRYWTPTRASYFDHVSKARIAEVVTTALSPKVASDLSKMKKVDAAAAAELRLAKSAWLPEILTDREVPATPSWAVHEDEDEGDPDAVGNTGDTRDGEDASNGPDAESAGEHTSSAPRDAQVPPATDSNQPPWPFPTDYMH
ncbi:hypothetical protein HDG32_001044 [Paraburkholderia sp. CI2]|nr:hypothetical protein [Paraburkholderia sp. CI2]MBB5464950.1 hypothetical protein [Paraburkholderia sp. CI2]